MILKSLTYFVAAGLCEIGGGYLVWLWLRENRSPSYAIAGAVALVLALSNPTAGKLWTCLRGIRRRIYRSVDLVGLAN